MLSLRSWEKESPFQRRRHSVSERIVPVEFAFRAGGHRVLLRSGGEIHALASPAFLVVLHPVFLEALLEMRPR